MNKNEWHSTSRWFFAQWSIFFPNFETDDDAEKIYKVAQNVLDLGQKYQVYHLLETSDGFNYDVNSSKNYIDFMREVHQKEGYIPFFPAGIDLIRSSSVVSYYQNGKIVDSEVDNMSDLLKRLESDGLYQDENLTKIVEPISPISILGGELELGVGKFKPNLLIQLRTNIWFPQIFGRMSKEKVDNSQLANRHTPRLNSFLNDLSEFTKSLDLVWRCDKDFLDSDYYEPWLDETGIILDKG